jgi:putative transposase
LNFCPPDLAEMAFRYSICSPLLDPGLSEVEKRAYRRSILNRAHEHPTRGSITLSARSLRRWVRVCRIQGSNGLLPKPRKDRGPRVLKPEHLKHVAALLRENPRRNTEFLLEDLVLQFPELKGQVGKSTLNRHLQILGVSRRVETEGSIPGPPYKTFEAGEPNALWHSDCHHGPPAIGVNGKVVPTRIFAWIDDFSRVCCHCEAYPDESLPSLEDCLKKAMQKFGIPTRVYTDRGSVYSGIQFALICSDLEIHPIPSAPYSPWTHGKIERLWGVQEDQLWSEIALLPPVPLAQLNRYLRAWVDTEHHNRIHSSTGVLPLKRWRDNKPLMIRYPTPEQIQRLFWLWARRKVTTTGIVHLCRNDYYVDPVLAGRKVIVRYDPMELTKIQAWSTERRPKLLCEATAAPLLTRRQLAPPPPPDKFKPSPAARRRIERLEQKLQKHLSKELDLIQFDTIKEKD